MDISFLTEYMVPVIIGLCLCIGYVVKHWVKDIDNKIIPTLCAVLGVLVALWMNWGNITPAVILAGLASGLASTGLHQAVTQWFGSSASVYVEEVNAEDLDRDQLLAVALQMGLQPKDGATREELLALIEAAVDPENILE